MEGGGEIPNKFEEKQETLMQKRRLEFLMKQADVYAHLMARKLGMTDDKDIPGVEIPIISNLPKVEVDKDTTLKNIEDIIKEHQEYLDNFDENTQKLRVEAGGLTGETAHLEKCELNDLINAQNSENLDLSTADIDPNLKIVETPKSFHGNLKEYQLEGLRWLDNLYEQGTNGILTNDMNSSKTIQVIALLSHISENKGNWGPFLVVAPASTLYHWKQEINRFNPNLKVLPYWGSLQERKTLKKYFQQKYWGSPDSQFHILVTSYQLIVADEKAFDRMKWQYMVLDEAQVIKNTSIQRWKILMSFDVKNKLLLTDTPIQNTIIELWSLLYFIMPKLFDSHDQVQDWFSKDIEENSQEQKSLHHHISRLHSILKPFIFRRTKKDIGNEIGQKKEYHILCEMTTRQAELYQTIKNLFSINDFFEMSKSNLKAENLMNLVMQLRKVCNHPDLFERRKFRTPLTFRNYYYCTKYHIVQEEANNPIVYQVPKLVFKDLYDKFDGREFRDKSDFLRRSFPLWDSNTIHESLMGAWNEKEITHNYNIYSFSRLLDLSPALVELCFKYDNFYTILILLHSIKTMGGVHSCCESASINDSAKLNTKNMLWINSTIINYRNMDEPIIRELIKTPSKVEKDILHAPKRLVITYIPKVQASYFDITCSSTRFTNEHNRQINPRILSRLFYGSRISQAENLLSTTENIPSLGLSNFEMPGLYLSNPQLINELFNEGLYMSMWDPIENPHIEIPGFENLIADSAKLRYLDKLLPQLKREGHRVLIFCKMTKMMDILEEYLNRRRYQFFRLDESCTVADRRDMIAKFQKNDKIFAFLLSTRAGALGVTLTAADVVIFYDNDWNLTIDAQAADRAHMLGPKKNAHVYRLIAKGTVEEKILKRAQQKQNAQTTVYSEETFKGDIFKSQEIMGLLFDESEINVNETKKFLVKSSSRE